MQARINVISIGVLAVVVLAMFGDVLFTAEPEVLSRFQTDLSRQFIHWRHFGFSQIGQGNLPVWNPYIFSGTPYLAGFQSALLYPPNWLYLVLPLASAINIGIVLHILLGGIFMFCWAAYRGISVPGRLLSALLFMFCGAHYMHVYAGHLPNLCTLVWAPLLYLAIDGLFDYGKAGWVMLGAAAVSMQILAGHPQYVYYTAMSAMVYTLLHIIGHLLEARKNETAWFRRLSGRVSGVVTIYLGAAAITAVQLFPGLQAAGESVRGQGLSYDRCAMFSFPPENILTLIAPCMFGDTIGMPYWGRCFLWEMLIFISLGGLVLAVCGSIWGERQSRYLCLPMCLICTILALGVHTPLFDFLFHLMPGFETFRGTSKFMFLTSIFLILLSGTGFDWLIRLSDKFSGNDAVDRATKRKQRRSMRSLALVVLATGIVLFIGATSVRISSSAKGEASTWHAIMKKVLETKESYLKSKAYDYPPFIAKAGLTAWRSLLLAACTLLAIAIVLFFVPSVPRVAYVVGVISLIEIFIFANHFKATFNLDDVWPPPRLLEFLSEHPGDYRVFSPDGDPNQGMISGVPGIWGYDPGVSSRYAQFMTFTQKGDPDKATQHITFRRYHKLYSMLRCRYLLSKSRLKKATLSPILETEGLYLYELPKHLPRVLLVENWLVQSDRDQIFSSMTDHGFDPKNTVILEQMPVPTPQNPRKASSPGEVKVVESSTDHLMVHAELSRPAILVITDPYYSGWRVTGEKGNAQQKYQLLPADYIFRAVPLAAGNHVLTIEYSPLAFRMGIWVSIISIIVYIVVSVWLLTVSKNKGMYQAKKGFVVGGNFK